MTIITNWYSTDNKEGVNLNQTQTISPTANPDYPAPSFALLERVQGCQGSEWVFVKASTTVTQFMAVVIDNLGNANDATSALIASNVYAMGIAEFQTTQANPGDYFWALLKADGGVAVNVSPSVGRGVPMYIAAATPGAFTSSANTTRINNISLIASIGTSASGPGEAMIFAYMQPSQNFTSSA